MVIDKCAICKKEIHAGDPCHFVKAKGKPMRWYCMECVKGGGKNGDADGKRH